MHGYNKIVGKMKDLPIGTLKYTTMFLTLQGEGPYAGQPAFFLRLTGCNLSCNFCDSYFDEGTIISYAELEALIHAEIEYFNKLNKASIKKEDIVLVVTGGEPTIQGDNLWQFIQRDFANEFNLVQIETNGMYEVPSNLNVNLDIVCSPKCTPKGTYIKPHGSLFLSGYPLYFKFILTAEEDSPYHVLPDWATEQSKSYLTYVSPMNMYLKEPRERKIEFHFPAGSKVEDVINKVEIDERVSFWDENLLDREANQRNHEYAGMYALKHGLILNLQQHLYVNLP